MRDSNSNLLPIRSSELLCVNINLKLWFYHIFHQWFLLYIILYACGDWLVSPIFPIGTNFLQHLLEHEHWDRMGLGLINKGRGLGLKSMIVCLCDWIALLNAMHACCVIHGWLNGWSGMVCSCFPIIFLFFLSPFFYLQFNIVIDLFTWYHG